MADWTALAGASGLAAALEAIQSRRVREGQLQKELTANQGTWTPATGGMGGPLGFFDALFGFNRPGEIGFGNQRFQFQPYPTLSEADVKGLGLTYPESVTTPGQPSMNLAPPGAGFGRPAAEQVRQTPDMTFAPADTTAYPFVARSPQTVTRDVPIPGFVGTRMDPKTRQALALETFKERRAERQRAQVQKLLAGLIPDDAAGTLEPPPAPQAPSGTPGTPGTPGTITQTPLTQAPTPPAAQGAIPGTDKTSPQFMAKAQKISSDLGMRLDDFLRVMSYETNGSFSPSQKNIGGKSSGTGLIQFLSKTAKGLGTTTEALAAMTPEQQLDYVAKYLAPYKGKIGTLQDLYMAVLSPTMIGAAPNATVFRKDKNPAEYTANAALDVDKKGYITVSDATNAVMSKTGGTAQAQAPASAPAPGQPDTRMLVAGPGAPAPSTTPSPTALRDQARLQKLDAEIPLLQKRLVVLSGHTGAEATAALALGRQVLSEKVTERNTLRGQLGETERAVEKEKALQPLKLEQARIEGDAAAARAAEAKRNEPIGVDAGRKMNLPPTTKWRDVPPDARTFDDPGSAERKVFADLKGSADGIQTLLTKLDNPEVSKMVGTLLSADDDAAFRRLVSNWISSLTPAQRKFAATLAREVAEIRHQLIGAGQTGIEMESLKPFLPTPADVDAATIRAKLESLHEGLIRRHDAYRDQLDQLGIRTPRPLARPEPKPSTSTTGNTGTGSSAAPSSTQDRLLKKYAR